MQPIKTGTLVKDARRLCPGVIPVQANHRLYTDYHERILTAVSERVSRSADSHGAAAGERLYDDPPASAAGGIETTLGNHSFRTTGTTAYLKNGGTLEKAAAMANHASTRTTELTTSGATR
jgi:hypothetical protein